MRYLVCTYQRPIHLTCRALWLADTLRRKGYDAVESHGIVTTSAHEAVVELMLSYRPIRTASTAFVGCDAA